MGKPAPQLSGADPAAGQPVAKVRRRRRTVSGQVGANDDRSSFVRIRDSAPSWARHFGAHECHPAAVARTVDQLALPRQRLEKRSPARPQLVAQVVEPGLGDDRRYKVLTRQGSRIERLTDSRPKDVPVLDLHPEITLPAGQLPASTGSHQ